MNKPDIINIAGLGMNGKDDGIEIANQDNQNYRTFQTIAPTPMKAAREHPDVSIERTMKWIQEAAYNLKQTHGDANIILIGRSYGGLIALAAAVRLKFEDILKVITFEAPLHPNETVKAPTLFKPLAVCSKHYDNRPKIGQECADYLQEHNSSPVVMVQGGNPDAIVPLKAQVLPGDFEHVVLNDSNVPPLDNEDTGHIITLPSHLRGEKNSLTQKALPENYRNHLFWSAEKMDIAMQIINQAIKQALKPVSDVKSQPV